MLSYKELIAKNFINLIGWRTKSKFVVIESDDWGTIRMPNRKVFEILNNNGIPVTNLHIDKYDSLESTEDLEALFEVLNSVKDCNGNSAVLTAYHVMANPNFEEIEKYGRKKYVYETILDSYKRNKHTENSFQTIEQGMNMGIYIPQFHGREHIHVKRWLEAINSNSKKEKLSFENKAIIWTKSQNDLSNYSKDYFKGFDFESPTEANEIEIIHKDGLRLFGEIFNMKSITFTAQGSVWGDHILSMLYDEGVRLIGGFQLHPTQKSGYKTINKYWGSKNELGQIIWRRNVLFEPSSSTNINWVDKCIEEIEIAFRWGKPAVISSHRENFIGSVFEENRNQSLKKLELLLKTILKRWPDVQFISSAKLAEIMLESK